MLLAEGLGTALLVTVVVGSGAAAERLSPGEVGLQLLANSTATAFGLAVLILMLGPVSGAHFNPVVTLADRYLTRHDPAGRFTATSRPTTLVALYVTVQVLGAVAGALLADAMFGVPSGWSVTHRDGWRLWTAEVVATAVLVLLIFALTRTGRHAHAPAAVGAYIGAAYWFTASTSFANPAVTVGRAFTDSFAGIAPASVPGFVVAQLVGGALGVLLVLALYPSPKEATALLEIPSPSVLFACRANAGRSVTARVLAEHYGGGRIEVHSAGSEPAGEIHPEVAAVLTGLGLDITREAPKPFDPAARYTTVVTMGCGDTCPYYAGASYDDWPIEDPKGQDAATVARIVQDIDARVRDLLARVAPGIELPPSVVVPDGTRAGT
jgi:arsenate reductase